MTMVKSKKKRWITVAVVVALAAAGILAYRSVAMNAAPAFPVVEVSPLERTDLKNTVSVTGNVESVNSKKIFSRLSYPVEELLVEVGDRVGEGDLLCRLDTTDLENSIAKQQATVNKSQTSASVQLTDAQKELENAQELLEKDLNSQLLSAQSAVRQAEANMDKAAINLIDNRNQVRDGRDRDEDETIQETYENAERTARITYDEAKAGLEDAKKNLMVVEESIRQQLEKYQSSINNTKKTMDFTDQYLTIQELKDNLEKCEITAPVSGVVTAIYVEEGATPSGLMFVIEDTDSLKISTRVMEYDIANVKSGDPVEIKSDATGDITYKGKLDKIAPTSVKNAQGNSDTTSDTEFEAEVSVTGKTDLKIGMKTRMNIIYEEKANAFSVPYDAIAVNENGEDIVYVAKTDETGAAFARAVVVKTGMSTDFSTEISSSELEEGDMIITNITGIIPDMQVTLMPSGASFGGRSATNMPRGGMVVMGG